MSDAARSSPGVFSRRPHELLRVGGGVAVGDAPAIVIEPSASLRVTLWLPACDRGGRVPVASEAGALAMRSHELDESAVLDVLHRRHGRLATSQVLCADGLVELYRAICTLRGVARPRLGAQEIMAQALDAGSPECARAASMFCGGLGDLAGRAALTTSAAGGVFIAGDLVPPLGDWFVRSPFRRRFEACAGDAQALRAIPSSLVLLRMRRTQGRPGDPARVDTD